MNVGITYDLRDDYLPQDNDPVDYYGEFDSEETIRYLDLAIQSMGHNTYRIGNITKLINFVANRQTVDIIFNISEGRWGRSREAQVPALLEAFRIPYTFSDPLTLSLCLDKAVTKRILRSYSLPTPDFCVVSDLSDLFSLGNVILPAFPLFVKPINEGTSKGIGVDSVVNSNHDLYERVEWLLNQYRQPVIIESYLTGREFTVGILGNGRSVRILGAVEIILKDPLESVYGFAQKEECEIRVLYNPVDSPSLLSMLAKLALEAYSAVGCRDAGRVDIRLDKHDKPQLLEINPLPGLHPTHSDLTIIGTQAGITYEQLIFDIFQYAAARYSM